MSPHNSTVLHVQTWSEDPLYAGLPGNTPNEVKSTYRFLATLRCLRLVGTGSFFASTQRLKIARMVIKRLMEMS